MPSSKPPKLFSFQTSPCQFFPSAYLSCLYKSFRWLKSFSLFNLFSRILFLLVDVFLREVCFFQGRKLVWKPVCINELVSHYASLLVLSACTSCLLRISSALSAEFFHLVKLTSRLVLNLFGALILRFSFQICIV